MVSQRLAPVLIALIAGVAILALVGALFAGSGLFALPILPIVGFLGIVAPDRSDPGTITVSPTQWRDELSCRCRSGR